MLASLFVCGLRAECAELDEEDAVAMRSIGSVSSTSSLPKRCGLASLSARCIARSAESMVDIVIAARET